MCLQLIYRSQHTKACPPEMGVDYKSSGGYLGCIKCHQLIRGALSPPKEWEDHFCLPVLERFSNPFIQAQFMTCLHFGILLHPQVKLGSFVYS